jgi:hypothetical protein
MEFIITENPEKYVKKFFGKNARLPVLLPGPYDP